MLSNDINLKPYNNVPRSDVGFGERKCACCGKVFLVLCPIRDYTYKIMVNHREPTFYCCYSHYKAAQGERTAEIAHNKAAYVQRRAQKEGRA